MSANTSLGFARRLPPLPRISDIIQLYNLTAKSQLGQNFLLDLNVTDKMVRVAGRMNGCCVCEVGPGPGSLSRSILNAGAKKLVAIEKDSRFMPSLELLSEASGGRLDVYRADALDFDIAKSCAKYVRSREWDDEPPNFHIIGNLPFNVSIPLLLQWLSMIPKKEGLFQFGRSQLTLTFQKEVAERIVAEVNDHQRSRPSIMTQNFCEIRWGFVIGSKNFVPHPKVEAVVLRLTPLVRPLVDVDFETLEKVVKLMFQYRRKFVRRGTMLLFPTHSEEEQKALADQLLKKSGVHGTMRAQELTVKQFGKVAQHYKKYLSDSSTLSPPDQTESSATSNKEI